MGNSSYCIFVILLTQIPTAFIQGFNLTCLNSAAPVIERFIIQSYEERYGELPSGATVMLYLTLAQSLIVWGGVLGALSGSLVMRKLSPKKSMLLTHLVNVASVILSSPVAYFTGFYEFLILGRFIAGVSRGLAFTIATVFVAETSTRSRLGFYQSPFQCIFSVSAVLGAGLGHGKVLGQPSLWAWLVSLPAIASAIYVVLYHWIPETPVYFLRRHNDEKAEDLLRRLRTDYNDVLEECAILKQEVLEESRRKPMAITTMLKSPDLRLQFIVAVIVMNTLQLAGTQAVMLYSDEMLIQAGVDPAYVTFATMGINGQVIVTFAIFYFLEKRIGTKRMYVIGISIATIGILTLTISNGLHDRISWMSNLAIAGMITLMFGIQVGVSLTAQSLPSEITTSSTRPTVTFYSSLIFWTNGAITSLVFPYSFDAFGVYAYVPYVVLCAACIPFGIFVVPETHRQTNIQIQASLQEKSSTSLFEIFTITGAHRNTSTAESITGDTVGSVTTI